MITRIPKNNFKVYLTRTIFNCLSCSKTIFNCLSCLGYNFVKLSMGGNSKHSKCKKNKKNKKRKINNNLTQRTIKNCSSNQTNFDSNEVNNNNLYECQSGRMNKYKLYHIYSKYYIYLCEGMKLIEEMVDALNYKKNEHGIRIHTDICFYLKLNTHFYDIDDELELYEIFLNIEREFQKITLQIIIIQKYLSELFEKFSNMTVDKFNTYLDYCKSEHNDKIYQRYKQKENYHHQSLTICNSTGLTNYDLYKLFSNELLPGEILIFGNVLFIFEKILKHYGYDYIEYNIDIQIIYENTNIAEDEII